MTEIRFTRSAPQDGLAGPPAGSAPYRLGAALATVSVVAAALTFAVPGILTGPPAMNGSARGTALVVAVVAVPVMIVAMTRAARGSARAVVVWLGAAAYLIYNAQMFLYATPFNELFVLYVAMLALSLWTVGVVLRSSAVPELVGQAAPAPPVRAIAAYVWVTVAFNTLVWLRGIVPALFEEQPTAFLVDTGLTTNPVYVQDLALWLPLATVAATWMWGRRPWGILIVGTFLTMWVLEAISVAVDQAFGHAADPYSSVAATGVVWMFAVVAVVGLVPLLFYFRRSVGQS